MLELCTVASAAVVFAILAVVAAVGEERLKAEFIDLTIGGDWWFDQLYGIPHHWASSISPLMFEGSKFVALPRTPYFLIMLISPWWTHCRHAAAEFDRLAEALSAAGADDQLKAVSLDCSSLLMRSICSRFLGDPRPVAPVWQDGTNSPKIGKLAFRTFADPWPAAALPTLLLGSREDFLVLGSGREGVLAEANIARISPAPRLAEDMLSWALHTGMEPISGFSLSDLLPASRDAFQREIWHLRQRVGGGGIERVHDETVQGCMCRSTWRHCIHAQWGVSHPDENLCHMKMGCPADLRFCKTVAPCGDNQEMSDRCEPPVGAGTSNSSEAAAPVADTSHEREQLHGDEEDALAALALWLHEIFSRHAFEVTDDDPSQGRRFALVRFLQLLCSYFPDHLEGWDAQQQASQRPGEMGREGAGAQCRESLCRLGGILETDHLWERYTEVVDAALELIPEGGRSPVTGEAPPVPPLLRRRAHVRRFRWHELELDWRLCNRPWIEYGQQGWDGCQSKNPFARGFPCGVWNLLHAVTAELAQLQDCHYAAHQDVDVCLGPADNESATELMEIKFARQEEKGARVKNMLEERSHNATLPDHLLLGPADKDANEHGQKCWKVISPNKKLNFSVAANITAELEMEELLHGDVVECTLRKFGGRKVNTRVSMQLVDDFRLRDGGAVVARVVKGPDYFRLVERQFWKVRDIGGVYIKGLDWRKVLKDAYGSPKVILEGPVPCNRSDPLCKLPCAVFKFQPDEATSWPDAPSGLLVEQKTGKCFGHWKASKWIFWSEDLGIGLVDCNGATKYRYRKKHEVQQLRFCNEEYPDDCNRPLNTPNFQHRTWVPLEKAPPEVPALVVTSRDAVDRMRTMIAFFWRCKECRERFLTFEYDAVKHIHHPKDAVLWFWKVHNEISSQLKTAADHAEISPFDKEHPKSLWPPRSLCPGCWKPEREASDKSKSGHWSAAFVEDQVYHFMVGHFYLSSARRQQRLQHTAALQQAWTPLPSAVANVQRRVPVGILASLVALITIAATIAAIALKPSRDRRRNSGDAFSARQLRDLGGVMASGSEGYMPCSTSSLI